MKEKFINQIKQGAIKSYLDYGIFPSLIMAQAILESGWGRYHIGNNIFGIKATPGWKGKTVNKQTKEHFRGKQITMYSKFRAYDSFDESIRDHALLLTNNKRYAKVLKAQTYQDACYEIYKAGYASDPSYPNKLITLIEQNKLYEIDKEAMLMKNKDKQQPIITSSIPKNIDVQVKDPSSKWAEPYWKWATAHKIMDGTRPKQYLTREQAAKIIYDIVVNGYGR